MIKKNIINNFLIIVFLLVCIVFPHQADAFSFQQLLSPTASFFTTIKEKVEYVLAFTPASKVKVLENQAQRRLSNAQNQVKDNINSAENSIKEYQDIKNKQNSFLDKVDDSTLKQVKEQTIEEQKTLANIGNTTPSMGNAVKTVNNNIVGGIKNIVTLKEGTTAGEAFDQKATIIYAPGTGPSTTGSGGPGTLIIEGGELQKFAPGTSGSGQGGQTIQGGELKKMAPGTSGGNAGETKIEGDKFAPGTSGGGESGKKVEGGNPGMAPGTSLGGSSGQKVVTE